MRLDGKRVYLRPLSLEDADGNYPNWLNDSEVCRYNSHGDILYTKEMAQEYIKGTLNSFTCKVFAICLNEKNQHIGNISLQSISTKNQSAEFAILMGEKSFWGQGYAKEASDILVDYGLNILNLHRIYCGTSEANKPMQTLALAIGMKQEGKREDALFKNDEFHDVYEYGLVKRRVHETV